MLWIGLVLLYGFIKGTRDIVKKKAMGRSTVMEVLFFYTLLSFVMVLPDAGAAMKLDFSYLGWIALKAFVVFLAWICGGYALERMPVSLYGLVDLSRMLFATLIGVLALGERMTVFQVIGFVLVAGGLVLLRLRGAKSAKAEKVIPAMLALAVGSSLFNSISATMDKVLMKSMESAQLQFWFMLFLVVWYGLYLLVRRERVSAVRALKNGWIWLMSILLVAGDRALFAANGIAGSRVTVMTLLMQSSVIVTILGGRLVFHEKDTVYKLMCAAIIITGIVVAVL